MNRRGFVTGLFATGVAASFAKSSNAAECASVKSGDSEILGADKGYLLFRNPKIYDGIIAFKYDPKSTFQADQENGSGVLNQLDFGGRFFGNEGYAPGSSGYRFDPSNKSLSDSRCACGSPKPNDKQVGQARAEAERLLNTQQFKLLKNLPVCVSRASGPGIS